MYSKPHLLKKYIYYHLTASNGRGHGIHSPFVFDFIKNVLRDKRQYESYRSIEAVRKKLLLRQDEIEVDDLGAGSTAIKTKKRLVADIARSSLKSPKYAQLLYRIVRHYQSKTILELGTSFGISTAYMAVANETSKVYTIEGSPTIATIAKENFKQLDLRNIGLLEGNFDTVLPALLNRTKDIDLAFVDGNHRKESTLNYFQQILAHANDNTVLIFDDIHWSREMEEAWEIICQADRVTLTIDLFFIGLVFVNRDFKKRQDFKIRF